MKYKLKILPENGGYVGYALLNDEVVYTTNVYKDTVMASRDLSSYVASVSQESTIPVQKPADVNRTSATQTPFVNNLVPVRRSTLVAPPQTPPSPIQGVARPSSAPVRKCCGRG